jgi:hypothetical protein
MKTGDSWPFRGVPTTEGIVVKWTFEGSGLAGKPKIVLGADHAGFALKERVRQYLLGKGYDVDDQGPLTPDPRGGERG